jgi:carbamoyltransferase
MTDTYLGPEYSAGQVKRALVNAGLEYKEMDDEALFPHIAGKIAQNKIVGWFQGKMEFGPRALGNRSILANPCAPHMKDYLNHRVKNREPFRPFAPAALEERASEFFAIDGTSPFMLLSPRVREDKKTLLPSVTHVDGTARLQTVSKVTNPRFWQLIKEFEIATGIPVLLNTSFNLRGEPIVCSPQDAINDFMKSNIDFLVLGNCVVEKKSPSQSPV